MNQADAQRETRTHSTAVITGGARGFGKAFGAALAAEGAHVVLVDLDAAEAAAVELRSAGGSALGLAGNVADEARMREVMAEAAKPNDGIHILINNAGLHSQEYSRPIRELGLAKTRQLFEVNVMGTVCCTLAAQPFMEGRAGAGIINISSSAAFQGGGYGTSKLAVIGLTMTFARELAPGGIRVNAIAPGIILTETISRELPAEKIRQIKSAQYLSDNGTEQDIVEAMLFLTSPRARFITGETLRVTGGYMAGI